MLTFVNISQMPPYLSASHFDDWLVKFNHSLAEIGLSKWDTHKHNISVELSNEKKNEQYGTLTIEELKDIIRTYWGNHKEIEEILDKIDNYDDYHKILQELMGVIYRIYPERDCRNPEELLALLEELEFEIPVLGEYINRQKLIILYIPNIEKAAVDHGNKPPYEFEKVFVHELFHAYHYGDYIEELAQRHDYTCKVVKESLASAFEWFYCVENKIKGDNELKNSWYKYSMLFYPYSGARRLLSEVGSLTGRYCLNSKKFREIYEESLKDMDCALRDLLYSYEFYRIKNLIHIYKKKTNTDLRQAFDKLMKMDDIGVIAHREITSIIRQPKNRRLIQLLLDLDYSYEHFHATQYPILSTAPMLDRSGRVKSYSKAVHRIGKKEYFLTQQWNTKQIDLLLDWIWAHR